LPNLEPLAEVPISIGHLRQLVAYRPQMDEEVEHAIQIFRGHAKAGVINFMENEDAHLPLVGGSYNNIYCAILGIAPQETFYVQGCRISNMLA
jgi:hypothetical protein